MKYAVVIERTPSNYAACMRGLTRRCAQSKAPSPDAARHPLPRGEGLTA